MNDIHLTLTVEEQALLIRLLEGALGETRAELHHTRTPDFRDGVKQEGNLLRGLLEKLRQPAESGAV